MVVLVFHGSYLVTSPSNRELSVEENSRAYEIPGFSINWYKVYRNILLWFGLILFYFIIL